MRKLIFVALLTAAPVFTLGSTPAEAFGCGWFGFGSATYSYAPAPRTYSYAPARRYYYAPPAATMDRGSTTAGPSIAPV